jgi:hypothetical protein
MHTPGRLHRRASIPVSESQGFVVNARSSVLTAHGGNNAAAARGEHISIEADVDYVSDAVRPSRRKVRSKYTLTSSMRKCSTELGLLEEHYLQVRVVRARKEPLRYLIDLRFLNTQPVRVRRIAWTWFALSAMFAFAAAGGIWFASSTHYQFTSSGFLAAGVAIGCAIGATVLGIRSTSESLNFTSVNGGATLVSILGGLGSTKAGKAFFIAVIKDIAAAKAARPQPKQQWLRDEMREHHRLRELGLLSEAEYEASKTRILRAHG